MTRLLLDSNLLSESRKGKKADPAVVSWERSTAGLQSFISVISLLEIRLGIRKVKRTDAPFAAKLETWYRTRLLTHFSGRILPIDQAIAEARASFPTDRTLAPMDGLIAATARVHRLTVATRNTADFAGTGANVVNPWVQGET